MLILVRHGRTAANEQRRLLGRTDLHLDDEGRRQVAALGADPPEGGPFSIVASPLTRALQTASSLVGAIEVDERWIEVDYGPLDGEPVGEAGAQLGRLWRADPSAAPAGVESLAQVYERVAAACKELLGRAEHGDVVVVSHFFPIKAAVSWVLSESPGQIFRLEADCASVTRIAVDARGPRLVSMNDTHHLRKPS